VGACRGDPAGTLPPAATGRPRADLRRVLDGIIHRMRSGLQRNQLPAKFGADSTGHGWFQRFAAERVLAAIWPAGRRVRAAGRGQLGVPAADAAMGTSRFDGGARGPSLTDRGKSGTKKSAIVDQHSGPLGS
jgi:transposase